jgi:hypothetical protein
MGYALPSGVINTDSVYFYADSTLSFGPLVKQPQDQTLVVLDYTTAAIAVDSFDFTVDVSSNPKLVIAYPQLDPTGFILSFLLSGGIPSQQYNISVIINSGSDTHTYILTVNIPSSGNCACETINPVPALYTQLPLGSDGYINSAARFFWGSAPPINPNVMDQWYNASTQTLYERMSDGVDFFWRTLYSPELVLDAPTSNLIYGRYNGFWVPEPIQAEAPQDGNQYARFMGGWQQVASGFSDAPFNNTRYGRYNGLWQADAIQIDAPSNASTYGRLGGAWVALAPIISEAPSTGQLYARINSNWQAVPVQSDAPPDGQFYARNNRAWIPIDITSLLADAPTDGTLYGRQDGAWTAAYPAGNPANYVSLAQMTAALVPFALLSGVRPFTGAVAFNSGLLLPNGPGTLAIAGGQPGQILVAATTQSTLAWAPPPIPEPANDGIAYARQNGVWVPTASGAGLADAPNDGTAYVRINATWGNIVHTDITDWDTTLTALLTPYALQANVPPGSIVFPLMDGTNAVGTAGSWARADHVHPTDTSRYSVTNPAGYQTAAQVTAALGPYAPTSSVPVASNAAPQMDGTAAAGGSVAYSRADHVHPTDTTRLALSGGIMSGLLTLSGDPNVALNAATKQYVDNAIATLKAYVDNAIANAIIDCGTY